MEDPPLAIPLVQIPLEFDSEEHRSNLGAEGQKLVGEEGREKRRADEQEDAVGITMITGYLGAGKTTVSSSSHSLIRAK